MNTNKSNKNRVVLASMSSKAGLVRQILINRCDDDQDKKFWSKQSINKMILFSVYNKNQSLVFKTFEQWNEEGKRIKKGAKAFILWGTPVYKDNGRKYYPLNYLFSNEQVY